MTLIKKFIAQVSSRLDDQIDAFSFNFKQKYKLFSPIEVVPYMTYGSKLVLFVKGRVLEKKNILKSDREDKVLANVRSMVKRFASEEVAGVQLKLSFQQTDYFVNTDKEGYFELNIPVKAVLQPVNWHDVIIEVLNAPAPFIKDAQTFAKVLVPGVNTDFGIISDIDDTIVETGATSLLKMARNTFTRNAKSRMPFEGIASFYRALEKGRKGLSQNPFFYVSSSPWNIYDFLAEFIEINDIPMGPLLLKDYGIENNSLLSQGHMAHKFYQIAKIIQTYPNLSFILIGDSGQEDPKIYQQVVQDFPGKILAIYIRDVNLPERAKIVVRIQQDLTAHKVPMILVENTLKASEHALLNGYIMAKEMPAIAVDKAKDEKK